MTQTHQLPCPPIVPSSSRRKKRQKLTDDQKLRRRAQRQAAAKKAKAIADVGPLFVDQIPADEFPTADDEYLAIRKSWAMSHRGHEAAYLANVDYKVDLMIVCNLAKRVMPSEDYELALSMSDKFGSVLDFWKNILLGRRRIVIAWDRISHGFNPCFRDKTAMNCCGHGCSKCESVMLGYIEKVIITERLVWPPPGYVPPLTKEQLEAYITLPKPFDFPNPVDPLKLA